MNDTAGAPPRGVRPAALGFILVTVFLDSISFGLVLPVLPFLIASFLGGDLARAAAVNGVFGTAWAAMQFLFSPLLGALSDRYGRRTVLLASLAGLGADYVLMALAPSLAVLFVGRVISGITAATYSTAYAYIADTTDEAGRARGFGLVGAVWGVAFVIGPAIGGMLGGFDQRLPFWTAAALTLANVIYGAFVLPESLPASRRARFSWAGANPIGSVGLLRARRGLFPLAAVQFLYIMAHFVLPQVFVLYGAYRYHWKPGTVGLVLAVVGVCTAIVQGALIGPAVRRLGESRALVAGLLAGAAAFALYGWAPGGSWFLCAIPIGACMGLYSPASQALMTRLVEPGEQGRLQGANSSLMGIAGMLAPLLYNGLFAAAIVPPHDLPGAPFYLAAALLLAATGVRFATRGNDPA